MDKEISIKDIFAILLDRIKLIIIVTLAGTAAGFVIAKFFVPLQYTSSIRIYVNNANSSGEVKSYQDQLASRSLATTYIVFLDDVSVYNEVSRRLIEDYDINDLKKYFTVKVDEEGNQYIPTAEIKKLVTISAVNDTEVIQITCTSRVPRFSADICTYIGDFAPGLIKRLTDAGSVEPVSEPIVPNTPSGPNIKLYTFAGFAVGLVISIILAVVLSLFDNAVTSGDEIKARFNVPILAEIPDIFMDEKGGGKYARYGK